MWYSFSMRDVNSSSFFHPSISTEGRDGLTTITVNVLRNQICCFGWVLFDNFHQLGVANPRKTYATFLTFEARHTKPKNPRAARRDAFAHTPFAKTMVVYWAIPAAMPSSISSLKWVWQKTCFGAFRSTTKSSPKTWTSLKMHEIFEKTMKFATKPCATSHTDDNKHRMFSVAKMIQGKTRIIFAPT